MVHAHLRCTSPIRVKWRALDAYVSVRCRSCSGCMRTRQYSWLARAAHEQAFAKRTWFATLTFGPRRRRAIMAAASADERDIAPTQRLITASGRYVSAYMKTLRKRGFALRYLWVPELHRDGFPHYHGLLHDQSSDLVLKWKDLSDGWSPGFSVFKVVGDAKALRYVTKYLSKEKLGRIRASQKYGEPNYDPADDTRLPGASLVWERHPQSDR